ncbi:MAG: ribonuclease HI [Alphaproteobacteria bacterium]|nr:ribonuclease HI [Alphaproteobacteria bacterium]
MTNAFEITNKNINDFIKSLHDWDLVEIYTDGSCMGNPGPGGWGAVFLNNNKRSTLSGHEENTTNNRMELMAAMKSISILPKLINIHVYTDSEYVRNGITVWIYTWIKNNWRTQDNKPVKNKDLWVPLYDLNEERSINWHWVKGHSNCVNNENADFLARSAIINNNK